MKSRRKFIKLSTLSALILPSITSCKSEKTSGSGISDSNIAKDKNIPVVISTWNDGTAANDAAWKILSENGRAIDAVEAGVKTAEANPANSSVGYGGLPDREGYVTLDACIMDENGNCGSVAFLEDFKHPISIARKVMETTPHVMLVGEGAHQFAIENGFEPIQLLTENSRLKYEEWLKESKYQPVVNIENHDTIGMLAIDQKGDISGACTTSGMAYKIRGRVGDSPIIGAGLFIDNEVGGAVATGVGEEIIKVSGSSIVVELMRNGYSPQDACKEMVDRIRKRKGDVTNLQVCFLALNKQGEYGAYGMYEGFNYAVMNNQVNDLIDSPYFFEYEE